MPDPSESLVALEQRLVERLLAFERLDEAWPRARTAIERAEIGRQREDALSEIVALRDRIVTGRAETLADATAQLRRLVVIAEEEHRPQALRASPGARGLVDSVLAVVEREAGYEAAQDVTLRNLLDTRKLCRPAARGGPRRGLGPGWPTGTYGARRHSLAVPACRLAVRLGAQGVATIAIRA